MASSSLLTLVHFAVIAGVARGLLGPSRAVTLGTLDLTLAKRPAQKHDCYRQTLDNFHDVQYTANITVGPQSFQGILDTGSYETLVFSRYCKTCGNATLYYDYNKSQTYHEGSLISKHVFGSGATTSLEGWDDISIGPLLAKNQPFWEVTEAKMSMLLHNPGFQAIVGVGPPEEPKVEAWTQAYLMEKQAEKLRIYIANGSIGPVEANWKEKSIEGQLNNSIAIAKRTSQKSSLLDSLTIKRFSVCLGKEQGSAGYWIWNDDAPRDHLDMFTAVPIVASHMWGVPLQKLVIGSSEDSSQDVSIGCAEGCGAIVDSGTSLLVLPPTIMKSLEKALAIYGDDCSNFDKFPYLKFNLGAAEFSLPPEAYLGKMFGSVPEQLRKFFNSRGRPFKPVCKLSLLAMVQDVKSQFGPLVILGLPFLRYYYTTFDLGSSDNTRSLFFAHADDQCEPAKAKTVSLLGVQQRFLEIDASKLRKHHWKLSAEDDNTVRI